MANDHRLLAGFSFLSGVLVTVLATLPSAEAVPVATVTATFIGVSATARDGNDGMPVMNADCELLDPRARMCRDTEILGTFPAPLPGVAARVLATEARTGVSDDPVTPYGLSVPQSTTDGSNCTRLFAGTGSLFNDTSPFGIALDASGNLAISSCAVPMVTACCAP